jgi:LmbE family N-acetylglucosaminyl deacetylase
MRNQKILIFVGAHPDDETFGIGGTLAQYAANGIKVYYVCATRGEVGVADPKYLQGYATPGEMRWAELKCAVRTLGLTDVIYLGYRDSGMPGSEDNKHLNALTMAPEEQVIGRVVKTIRDLKPDIVVTFDPVGGYRHPDHIIIHNATVKAFQIANDPKEYPESGTAFQPKKLYFSIFNRRLLRIAVKIMPLFGKNPHRFGRNQDIDLASMVKVEYPIHATIRLTRQAIETRDKAMLCHASQLGGGSLRRGILGKINNLLGQSDYFMLAYPVPDGKYRESDLFEGI